MNPLLAQIAAAAAESTTTTNRSGPLVNASQGFVQRFEEATGLPREVALWSVNFLVALLLLVLGYMGAGLGRSIIRKVFDKRNIDSTISGFIGNLVHALVMAFVIVTVLGQLGVDTKSFAAIIAAAGLAIGLALQGGLANFAAGFLIIVFRPFKAGDTINGAGIEGTVEEVQIFSTTLNTADNKRIIVPNSTIMGSTITNYTANNTRRVDLQLAVGTGQDLEKAHSALLALANADSRVLKTPAPAVANVKLIDLGTLIELRAWAKTTDFGGVSNDFIAKAPGALAQAGVKGPDRTLYYVERK